MVKSASSPKSLKFKKKFLRRGVTCKVQCFLYCETNIEIGVWTRLTFFFTSRLSNFKILLMLHVHSKSGYFRCLLTSSREKKVPKPQSTPFVVRVLQPKVLAASEQRCVDRRNVIKMNPWLILNMKPQPSVRPKNFGCDMCLLLAKFLRLPSMDTSYTKPKTFQNHKYSMNVFHQPELGSQGCF